MMKDLVTVPSAVSPEWDTQGAYLRNLCSRIPVHLVILGFPYKPERPWNTPSFSSISTPPDLDLCGNPSLSSHSNVRSAGGAEVGGTCGWLAGRLAHWPRAWLWKSALAVTVSVWWNVLMRGRGRVGLCWWWWVVVGTRRLNCWFPVGSRSEAEPIDPTVAVE